MIIDILILIAVTAILYFVIPFICDLLSIPFNALTYKRLKDEVLFGIHFQPKWFDLLLAFLAFCFFTYLFSGICASYLSWISERYPDNFIPKALAVSLGAGVASAFSRKAAKISLHDAAMSNLPSILGSMFVKTAVYIICVLLLIFPRLLYYWSWMPYVK